MRIQALLDKKIPFAIVIHHVSFRVNINDIVRKYELLFIDSKNEINFKLLDREEISIFKENIKLMNLVIDNKYGRVYEFNKFKEHKESLSIYFKI